MKCKMEKPIEIIPKDDTVGASLDALLEEYVRISNDNKGTKIHKIIVDDCLMYWDSEEVVKEWEQ